MLIPPRYSLTSKILQLTASIQASNDVIKHTTIPKEIELNIRRQSTLKSSVYSARIEGNSVTLDEFPRLAPKDKQRIEISNILTALNWIHAKSVANITTKNIQVLHAMVMKRLILKQELGRLRTENSAIYNSAGIAIYLVPPPYQIPKLLSRLIKFMNSSHEASPVICAALAHYTFEKIHPFLDGNGRVGRLLIQLVLAKGGLGAKGLLAIEEHLEKKREIYYRLLEEREKDVTSFVEFMLEVIAQAADEAKKAVLAKQMAKSEDFLLPRRAEILQIVKEHKIVNFNMISRRFRKINERTLRYDIKKLIDAGFVQKLGTTRGVYYKAKCKISLF